MSNVLTASTGDIYKLENIVYDTEVTEHGNLKIYAQEQYVPTLELMGINYVNANNGLVNFVMAVNKDNLEQLSGLSGFDNIMHLEDLFNIYPHLLVNPITIIPGVMDGAIMLKQGDKGFIVKTNNLSKLKDGIRKIRAEYETYTKEFSKWCLTARMVKGDNGEVMRFPNGLRVCLNSKDSYARVVIPNEYRGILLNFKTKEEFYLFIGKRYF